MIKIFDAKVGDSTIGRLATGRLFMYGYLYYMKVEQQPFLKWREGKSYALCLTTGTIVVFDDKTAINVVAQLSIQDTEVVPAPPDDDCETCPITLSDDCVEEDDDDEPKSKPHKYKKVKYQAPKETVPQL